ncbi:MAG: hypothetical protein MJ252_15525 [archaeon]|nr:hypothetical protein [archaeon]
MDDFFKGAPILIYEPSDAESEMFMSYFPNMIEMEGGMETGFKKVPVAEYKPRLLHVSGTGNNITSKQVPLAFSSLVSEDCFVLDNGLKIYNWRGKKSSPFEKLHATQIARRIESERNGEPQIFEIDQGEKSPENMEFRKFLRGQDTEISEKRRERKGRKRGDFKAMFKLSDEGSEKLKMTKVEYAKASLNSKDAFLIDRGDAMYVWTGKECSEGERKMGLVYAQKYMKMTKRPPTSPIVTVHEGQMEEEINKCFA